MMNPEMCECGHLYKDRRDEKGKTMCVACYSGLSIGVLKQLWSTPVPEKVMGMFRKFKDLSRVSEEIIAEADE